MRWYKNTTRTNEVRTLMQGLSLPSPSMVSASPLSPVQSRPTELPPPPQQPLTFEDLPDTVGQAWVNDSSADPSTSSMQPPSTSSTQPPFPSTLSLASTVTVATTSRTTDWRRRKREAETSYSVKKQRVERKGYTCRSCGQPMNKGNISIHTSPLLHVALCSYWSHPIQGTEILSCKVRHFTSEAKEAES